MGEWNPFITFKFLILSILFASILMGERLCIAQMVRLDQMTSSQFKRGDHSTLNKPPIKSVALSLHFELPELGLTYSRCLDHAIDLGATHVALIVQAQMDHIYASTINLVGAEVTSFSNLERVITLAKARDLKVILFPILWIDQRADGEWRGRLKPRDPDRWWSEYELWLNRLAAIGERHHVDMLSIGSELSSLEGERDRWRSLIKRLRVNFSGALTYSANWDHFEKVDFWDLLDMIGITAYYPLTDDPSRIKEEASAKLMTDEMIERWKLIRLSLIEWLENRKPRRPLFFTELGYPSQEGGAHKPWHYLQSAQVDLEVQRRAFEAFRHAWRGERHLRGVNIWNIWGLGGPHDAWYTLRGKPASAEVKRLFKSMDKAPRQGHKLGSVRGKSR